MHYARFLFYLWSELGVCTSNTHQECRRRARLNDVYQLCIWSEFAVYLQCIRRFSRKMLYLGCSIRHICGEYLFIPIILTKLLVDPGTLRCQLALIYLKIESKLKSMQKGGGILQVHTLHAEIVGSRLCYITLSWEVYLSFLCSVFALREEKHTFLII